MSDQGIPRGKRKARSRQDWMAEENYTPGV